MFHQSQHESLCMSSLPPSSSTFGLMASCVDCERKEWLKQTCQVSRFYNLSHAFMSWLLICHTFSKSQVNFYLNSHRILIQFRGKEMFQFSVHCAESRVWDTSIVSRTNWVGDPKQKYE